MSVCIYVCHAHGIPQESWNGEGWRLLVEDCTLKTAKQKKSFIFAFFLIRFSKKYIYKVTFYFFFFPNLVYLCWIFCLNVCYFFKANNHKIDYVAQV